MDASPFARILTQLLSRVPGAFAAALVDAEGETVDYAGQTDPFDIKVAAAELRLLLQHASPAVGEAARSITVRGARRSLLIRALPDGYALTVLFRRGAGFTRSTRAYIACEHDLAAEANWSAPPSARWFAVQVRQDARGRPATITTENASADVEILGLIMNIGPYVRGYRVRTTAGAELMLVREPGHAWYVDHSI
jgi:hypothetical protein